MVSKKNHSQNWSRSPCGLFIWCFSCVYVRLSACRWYGSTINRVECLKSLPLLLYIGAMQRIRIIMLTNNAAMVIYLDPPLPYQ